MPDKQLLAALHEQPKIDQLKADLSAFFAPISSSDEAEQGTNTAEIPAAGTLLTRGECMKGFRVLNKDWTQDTVFFIKGMLDHGFVMVLVKYAAGDAVDQDTAGQFWVRRLRLAT